MILLYNSILSPENDFPKLIFSLYNLQFVAIERFF